MLLLASLRIHSFVAFESRLEREELSVERMLRPRYDQCLETVGQQLGISQRSEALWPPSFETRTRAGATIGTRLFKATLE